jgi:hypothetical protein
MTRADLPESLRERLAFGVPEVAKLSGISVSCVRKEISLGRLQGRRVGGGEERQTWIVPLDALLRWLNGSDAPTEGVR